MSDFHSTVSRRDFMKTLGCIGAGVGGAALVAPVFHDADELMASSGGLMKRAWWIKERDFYNPTVETDWGIMKRRDPTVTGQTPQVFYGKEFCDAKSAEGKTLTASMEKAKTDPRFTYRNMALRASRTTWSKYVSKTWEGCSTSSSWKGAAFTGNKTPEERGEPKWTGSPEEATRMMSAFMRYRGSALTGFGPVGQREQTQLLCTNVKHNANKKWVFDTTADKAYQNATTLGIPMKNPMFYIVNSSIGSPEMARTAPMTGQLGPRDDTGEFLKPSMWNFLKYLGYQCLGDGGDSEYPFIEGCVANLAGLGEVSRQNLYTIFPEYGPNGRIHNYLTDLPVEPTKPIDAGMHRFCHDCHKCADNCPSGSISQDKEPSWEITPAEINGVTNNSHNVGTKEFWLNGSSCRNYCNSIGSCQICWGECTFTTNRGAMAHDVIRATITNVSLFNGFFYKMGEAFGYGTDPQKTEDWWDMSLPVLGMDSVVVSHDGGYNR